MFVVLELKELEFQIRWKSAVDARQSRVILLVTARKESISIFSKPQECALLNDGLDR
jgi:hypothetical protein